MKSNKLWLLGLLILFSMGICHAEQLPSIQHEQQEAARQNDMGREAELQQRDELRQKSEGESDFSLPEEDISFFINEIVIDGIDNHRF